jgi:hypothetical protein
MLPFQHLELTEYLNETVTLRAILTGTEFLSPVLYAPVEIISGSIAQEATYITRSMDLDDAIRLTAYLKVYLPGGSTLGLAYSIDEGPWTGLTLEEVKPLAFALWSERKFEASGVSGASIRMKITGTGGPAARLIAGDFGAGIF